MSSYKLFAVFRNLPLLSEIKIEMKFRPKDISGLIKPLENLSSSGYEKVINDLISQINFKDKNKERIAKENSKRMLNSMIDKRNPLALLILENLPIDKSIEQIQINQIVENIIFPLSLGLGFNYSLPIELLFFSLVNQENELGLVQGNFSGGIKFEDFEEYKEGEDFVIKPKEDLDSFIKKITSLYAWEYKKKKIDGDKKEMISRMLITYNDMFFLGDEFKISHLWTILTILSEDIKIPQEDKDYLELAQEIKSKISKRLLIKFNEIYNFYKNRSPMLRKIKILFENYGFTKEFEEVEFSWDFRGGWEHHRKTLSEQEVKKIMWKLKKVVDTILLKVINEEYKKIPKED